jgi:hypothetical protein
MVLIYKDDFRNFYYRLTKVSEMLIICILLFYISRVFFRSLLRSH